MKKTVYVLAFITCFVLSSGILFKIMHWPTANIQLVLGFAVLNLGLLPAYFVGRMRTA
jgi:hypothetical protein